MRMKKWRGGGSAMPLIVTLFRKRVPSATSSHHLLCRSTGHFKQGCIKWDQVITPAVIATRTDSADRPFVVRKWEIMLFLRDVDDLKMKRNVRFDEMLYPSGDDASIEQNCLRFLKEILFSDEEGNGHKLWLNPYLLKTKKRWKWLLLLLFAQTILMSRSHLICVCGLWSL